MKREFSAGGVVFQKTASGILWLIIKPRPSALFPTDRFQLPKGHIEKGEKAVDTAIREVFEETGIKAQIISKISDIKYVYNLDGEKIFKIVTFYLMEYKSGEPAENIEVEKILWLPFKEAYKALTFSSEKSILKQASNLLEQ